MSFLTLAAKAASEARCDVATTSIWRVNGWLGKVLIYIENPDKTENPDFFEKQDMDGKEAQSLADVIEYGHLCEGKVQQAGATGRSFKRSLCRMGWR